MEPAPVQYSIFHHVSTGLNALKSFQHDIIINIHVLVNRTWAKVKWNTGCTCVVRIYISSGNKGIDIVRSFQSV